MKKLSKINEENSRQKIELQENTINYIPVDQLKEYLEIAGKFLMQETRDVVNWLIVNNETYLHDLDPEANAENALADFYNRGIPKSEDLKELYRCIGVVAKKSRLIEIPVFQTKDQFESIINKKVSPDEVLLDLETEAGRSEVVEQYTPLIHKIIRQWIGKSNLGSDDLLSVAYEGITYAMNTFGKRKVRDDNGHWIESDKKDEKMVKYSFKQYAAYCIDNFIREEIKHKSHLVRIPASQQTKERETKGFNTKSFSVSGNSTIGHDQDGNSKTLFDYIDTAENGYKSIDNEDLNRLWKYVYTRLNSSFKKRDLEIFYSLFGLNGYKQIKSKDLAKKYGIGESAITPIKRKIISFIKNDKVLWSCFNDILTIVGEAKQDKYNEEDQYLEEHSTNAIKINQQEEQ